MARSDEDEAMVQALLREREGYVRFDREDRVAAVDAELERYGHTVEKRVEAVEVPEPGVETAAVEPGSRRGGRNRR